MDIDSPPLTHELACTALDAIAVVADLRKTLWAAGFRPVALVNANSKGPSPGKRPIDSDWINNARLDPPFAVASRPNPAALNTGILCDGYRVIDIDVDDKETAECVEQVVVGHFGTSPVRRREGSAKRALLYRAADGEPGKRSITGAAHSKTNSCKVEILGRGQQFAAFGFHPSGAFLDWDGELSPGYGVTRDNLTPVTEDQITELLDGISDLLGATQRHLAPPSLQADDNRRGEREAILGPDAVDISVIASALAVIPNEAAADWSEWKRIGMAIWRATSGSKDGYAAFSAWSAKNVAHNETITHQAWEEITKSPPDRIGAGTLFHLAREADPMWHSPGRVGLDANAQKRHVEGVRYPPGFHLDTSGLFYTAPPMNKDDATPTPIKVAASFQVIGQCRNATSQGWGIVLGWIDASGVQHEDIVPRSDLAFTQGGASVAARLEHAGLRCSNAPHHLRNFLNGLDIKRMLHTVDKSGWHRGSGTNWTYTLPTGDVFGSDGHDVILEPGARRIGDEIGQSGSLSDWKHEVARYAIGNSRLALFISASFAGMLLDVTSEPSGGLHLVGKSRSGKSSALFTAGSVWGKGTRKVGAWRATANGLEGLAKAANDGVLLLDEIGQADGRDAGDMIYMLANGTGRQRATVTGAARERAAWRVLYLSTGEVPLETKMAEANRSAATGLQVRLVNISADAGVGMGVFENLHDKSTPADFADHLRRMSDRFYGTPCREFIRQIAKMRATDEHGFRAIIDDYRTAFVKAYVPSGADGQVSSVAGRFGMIFAAGQIAVKLHVLPWPDDEAERAIATCFSAWLDQRGHVGAGEDDAVLRHLRALLLAYGDSRFSDLNSSHIVTNRLGFRKPGADGPDYLIAKELWDKEVFKGTNIDAKRALSTLHKQDLLKTDKDRLTLKVSHNGTKMNVVYIRSDILAD